MTFELEINSNKFQDKNEPIHPSISRCSQRKLQTSNSNTTCLAAILPNKERSNDENSDTFARRKDIEINGVRERNIERWEHSPVINMFCSDTDVDHCPSKLCWQYGIYTTGNKQQRGKRSGSSVFMWSLVHKSRFRHKRTINHNSHAIKMNGLKYIFYHENCEVIITVKWENLYFIF